MTAIRMSDRGDKENHLPTMHLDSRSLLSKPLGTVPAETGFLPLRPSSHYEVALCLSLIV